MKLSLLFSSLLGLFAACCGPRSFAATEPYWNWRNPLPQGNDYNSVAYGAGRFVAVGNAGTITTSTDGRTWTAANSGVNYAIYSIVYGNGRFVALGSHSNAPGLLMSEDGVSWTIAAASVPQGWSETRFLSYAGDKFYAGNDSDFVASINRHIVATSTDGVTWTRSASATSANVGRISYGGGAYLGQDITTGVLSFSNGGTVTGTEAKMMLSADGLTWTTGGSTGLTRISAGPIYYNGRWVVGGFLLTGQQWSQALSTSSDGGATWTVGWHADRLPYTLGGDIPLNNLAVFGGRLIILGDPNIPLLSTADCATVREDISRQMLQLNGLAATAGHIVASGRFGQLVSSDDGVNWTSSASSTVSGMLRAAAFGDGQWIVAGDAGLAGSPDAITWRMLPAGAGYTVGSIAYGNGRFVAGSATSGHVGVSTDHGATWKDSGAVGVTGGIAFANGRFVAASGLRNSTDGITWSSAVAPPGGTGHWTGIFSVNDVFYAIGTKDPDDTKDGVIARSVDGVQWTPVASMSQRLMTVGGKDDLLVACGEIGEVWTSTDGLNWIQAPGRPLMNLGPAASVLWVGGSLVGVTYYGNVITSDDGVTWTKDEFASSGMMLAMAAGNGQVLAIGNGGAIWEVGAARFTHLLESRSVAAGDSVTFSAGVTGKEPLSYQWLKDGAPIGASDRKALSASARSSPISGVKSRTLTIAAARAGDAGRYNVVVSNSLGSTESNAASLVVSQATAPGITAQPESKTVTDGATVTFSVVAVGDAPLSYQWRKDGNAIAGATGSTFTITAAHAADNGTYSVVVSNSAGVVTSAGAALSVSTRPGITSQPEPKTVTVGAPMTFSVVAAGDAPLTYQWFKDDVAIGGATAATYSIPATATADSGTYTVVVRNAAGTVTSNGVKLTVNAALLVNIAVRAYATTDNGVTIGGFVIAGSKPKQVLIRAVGPTLTTQGIGAAEVLVDPLIELHHGSDTLVINDNWGDNANAADITATALRVGANPLVAGDTKSAAMLRTLDPGVYTFIAKGKNNTSGVVLIEVYDADSSSSTFTNIAARARCTVGNGVAIGGFVITGNVAKQVLMRALGPTLTTQGLGQSEVLLDPTMELRRGSTTLATNDNWGDNDNAAAIVNVGARIGATPIDTNDTKSAALLKTLEPGVYSFIVKGKNETSGLVLVEIYDAD